MTKLGLKLWSINTHYIKEAEALYGSGIYDYIELSAIPDSFLEAADKWASLNVPIVIHAPHFMQGLNFSLKDKEVSNFRLVDETLKFADKLKSETIIFHPGIKGDYRETANQMSKLKDSRVVVENKPYKIAKFVHGLTADDRCVGYSPEQIEYIMDNSGVGFCLDIGHCFCGANGVGTDKYDYLKKFIALKPKMLHISDGDIEGDIDKHYSIGKGSYDFKKIFSLLPKDKIITLETEKKSKTDLKDFSQDISAIKLYI